VEGGSYKVVVSLTRTVLWQLALGLFDKGYAQTMAGSTEERTNVAPDVFTAETPLGTYQGLDEQVYLSKSPGSFRTVLVPRGSNKAEWRSLFGYVYLISDCLQSDLTRARLGDGRRSRERNVILAAS
jgi:hypothetical protein